MCEDGSEHRICFDEITYTVLLGYLERHVIT